MIRAFERLTQGVLAVLGEDALFNGSTRTRINVEFDVQFITADEDEATRRGDLSVPRDVATISVALAPRIGHTFRFVDADGVPMGVTYRLDRLVDGNGYSKRFVVLKVS
jgi:hypothetical protein